MNRKRPLPILVPKASLQKRSRDARHINLPGHQNQFQHLAMDPQNPRFLAQNLPPFDFPSSVQNGFQASSQLMPYQPLGSLNPGFPPMDFSNQIQMAPNHEFRNFVPRPQQPGPLQQPFPPQPLPQNAQLALQSPPSFQRPQPGPHNYEQYQQRPPGMVPFSQPPPSQFNFLPLPQLPGDKFQMQLPPVQNMLQARQHLQNGPSGFPADSLGNGQPIPPSQVVPLPPPQTINQNAQIQALAPQTPLGHPTQQSIKFDPRELQLIQNVLKQLPLLPRLSSTSQQFGEMPTDVPKNLQIFQDPHSQAVGQRNLIGDPARIQLTAQPGSGPLQNPAVPSSQQQGLPFNFSLPAQPMTCLAPQLPIQKVPSSTLDVQHVPTGGSSELQEALQEQPPTLHPVTQHGARSLQYPEMPTLYPEVLTQCSQDQLPQDQLSSNQPPKLVSQFQDYEISNCPNKPSTANHEPPQMLQNPLEQTSQHQNVSSSQEEPRTGPSEPRAPRNAENPLPCSSSIPEEVPNSDIVYQKVLKILQQASHEMLNPVQEPQPDPAQLEITKHSAILEHLFGSKSLEKFHRDPASLPHHFQFQLLTVPPHVPAPQTLEHLEEIVKFNQDKITRKSLKEEWILEKLKQFGGLHKKKIDLFKTCEFREDFLVKLYYKYHQIFIGSSSTNTVAFDDMEPFKKWMCTNAHCHREMMEVEEKLRASDDDYKKQVMKELRKAVKRSTKRLDPMFWRGLEQIQDVMLKAIGKPGIAAIVRREIKRDIRQLERTQHEPGPVVDSSDVEDYGEVGDSGENGEKSRAELEVAPHNSMAPHSEKRKEKDGLVDGQEENEVADLDELASTAKPQVLEDVSPGSSEDQLGPEVLEQSPPETTQEPDTEIDLPPCQLPSTSNNLAAPSTTQETGTTLPPPACHLPSTPNFSSPPPITKSVAHTPPTHHAPSTSRIYHVPIDISMGSSHLESIFAQMKLLMENTKLRESKLVIFRAEQAKLKEIMENLDKNARRLSVLKIQESERVATKLVQANNLQSIIMEKGENENAIAILKTQKNKHTNFVKEAEENVVDAGEKYEEAVRESKKFNESLYLAELSGNIFNDAMHTVDLMDESRYKILISHVENRRNLKMVHQGKQEVVKEKQERVKKIEEKIEGAMKKLEQTKMKEKEEAEKLEAEEAKLREVEMKIERFEIEKTKLEDQREEQVGVIKDMEREIERIGTACRTLEEQMHCSQKIKNTKSAMTSPVYPLHENNSPDFTSALQDDPHHRSSENHSDSLSIEGCTNGDRSNEKIEGSRPKRSYLRKLISREFPRETKPRIILRISREKYEEAERIRREQESVMEKEEEEEIERRMNDDGTDGGGEEGRAQQTLEAGNDEIGGRPKENKTKRRSLDGNFCDGEAEPDPQRQPSPDVQILKVVKAPEKSSRPKLTRKPRNPRIVSPPSELPEVCPKSLDVPVSGLDFHQLPPQNFEEQLQQHFYCAIQNFQNVQNQQVQQTQFPQNPSEAPHLLQNLQLELLSLPTIFLFPPKSLEQLFLLIHTNLRLKNTCIENTLQLIDCKRRATIHVENHFKLHMSKIGLMRKLMEKNQGVEEWVFIEYYLDYHRIKLGTNPDVDLNLFERFMEEKVAGYIGIGGGGKKQRQQEFSMGAEGILEAGQSGGISQNLIGNGRRIDQGEVVLELDKLTRLKEHENIKKWKEYFYKIEVNKLNKITKTLQEIPGKREVLERKEQVALKGLKCYRNILDQAFKHLKELEESVPIMEKEFEEQKKKVMEALEEADLATKEYNEAKEEFEDSGRK